MDREGCLWVGTDGGGLNRVRRQVFDVLEVPQGLTVQSVCEDERGGLWIGYNGGEVQHWSTNALAAVHRSPAPGRVARAVGVRGARTRKSGRALTAGGCFNCRMAASNPCRSPNCINPLLALVSAIYQDRNGMLWVGTQGGLVRWAAWDNPNWRVFTNLAGASASVVRAIADDEPATSGSAPTAAASSACAKMR